MFNLLSFGGATNFLTDKKALSNFFYSSSIITLYIFGVVSIFYYIKRHIFNNTNSYSISYYLNSILKYYLLGDTKCLTEIFSSTGTSSSRSFSLANNSTNSTPHSENILQIKEKGIDDTTFEKLDVCQDLNIGGLSDQVKTILKKAFLSRSKKYKEVCSSISYNHLKGIILYGPPGTGKTLIARSLSENILKCNSFKIVNGPELLDKWIGSSEKNIRDLFYEAEKDTADGRGEDTLHVIVFDELDSICRRRSASDDAGARCQSNIVNTLLSKMDGFDKLNNILIIGMTNNIELIDKALLRPGRFELHIKIEAPSKEGRKEIFKIHLDKISKSKYFSLGCEIEELSEITEGYTGADIEGLVRSVISKKLLNIGETRRQGERSEPRDTVVSLLKEDFESEIALKTKK